MRQEAQEIWVLIVILSDHPDTKKQEKVAYPHDKLEDAFKQRKLILKEGIELRGTNDKLYIFYPPHEIRKIVIQKERAPKVSPKKFLKDN